MPPRRALPRRDFGPDTPVARRLFPPLPYGRGRAGERNCGHAPRPIARHPIAYDRTSESRSRDADWPRNRLVRGSANEIEFENNIVPTNLVAMDSLCGGFDRVSINLFS